MVPSRPPWGAISPSTGRTLPDRYIEGTCPICGYDGARGDQCDNCGNQLDPTDLIKDPRSRINGETPESSWRPSIYFLDLPALADSLKERLDEREPPVTRLAAERAEASARIMLADLQAAGDHPGPGLGGPDPARRLARTSR